LKLTLKLWSVSEHILRTESGFSASVYISLEDAIMKRTLLIGFITALAFNVSAVFAGPSGESRSTTAGGGTKSGSITIWSTMTQTERAKTFDDLARSYEAKNPGVKVTVEVMPWDGTMDKVVASIMAKNPPEITLHGSGWPQTLAGTGGILEVSDIINDIGGAKNFLQMALDLGKYEDGYYSIPLYVTPYITMYRKSYLQQAGITKLPTTWEEFYTMCKAVTNPAKNIYGFGAPMTDVHSWKTIWVFLQSNEVDLVNVDKNGNWYADVNAADRAAIIEVYDYLYKLIRDCSPAGLISYNQTNVRELVAKGTIMSRIDTPEIYYDIRALKDDASLNDIAFFSFPGLKRIGSGTGWVGMGIQKDSNVTLAKDYIKYLYDGDTMVDFYASYPYAMFPVKNDMYRSAAYKAKLPPELQSMMPDMALEILSHATGLMMSNGPFPFAGEVESRKIFANPLINMFNKGITAVQAADELIAEVEALLN
jgi:ABC-type glycerol-3-phosphate transport system substrate-binding protein